MRHTTPLKAIVATAVIGGVRRRCPRSRERRTSCALSVEPGRAASELEGALLDHRGQKPVLLQRQVDAGAELVLFPMVARMFL